MVMSDEKKRGALSEAEKLAIRGMVKECTISEIADALNRTAEPILKYISEQKLSCKDMEGVEAERIVLKYKLHARPYFTDVKAQLTDEELKTFEYNWIRFIEQFNNNVTHTEELQIKEAIIVQILINRTLVEKKNQIETITRLQNDISRETSMSPELRDEARLLILETSLISAKAALAAYIGEYTKLFDKLNAIMRELKSTRDQRFKQVDDNRGTWAAVIKQLDEEEFRKSMSENMEIMKVAKERAKKNLQENHVYLDGKIDVPLLTPEYIESLEDEDT